MSDKTLPLVLAAAAAVGLLYLAKKGGGFGIQNITAGAVSAAGDAAAGAVLGVGDALGIPRTSNAKCEADLAAGDMWAASFSCPAPRFAQAVGRSVFGSTSVNHDAMTDARQIDRIIERSQRPLPDLGVVTDPATGDPVHAYDPLGNRIY